MTTRKVLAFISMYLLCTAVVIPGLVADLYQYTDENGTIHFVDDAGKIPKEHRNNAAVYEDNDASVPESQRKNLENEQRKRGERLRGELDQWLKEKQVEKQKLEEEEYQKSLETEIVVEKNCALVPTIIGYKGKELQVLLVFDTGASILLLYDEVAEQLGIIPSEKAGARVAGGRAVTGGVAKLDYVRVGPYTRENVDAMIIHHRGPPEKNQGLLGMNVLQGLECSIDLDKKVISWKPSKKKNAPEEIDSSSNED